MVGSILSGNVRAGGASRLPALRSLFDQGHHPALFPLARQCVDDAASPEGRAGESAHTAAELRPRIRSELASPVLESTHL